jgi:hypothetical protein
LAAFLMLRRAAARCFAVAIDTSISTFYIARGRTSLPFPQSSRGLATGRAA